MRRKMIQWTVVKQEDGAAGIKAFDCKVPVITTHKSSLQSLEGGYFGFKRHMSIYRYLVSQKIMMPPQLAANENELSS